MTKAEQARVTAWRLKVLRWSQREPRQVARTCRHFGISRTAFYRWKQRFDEHGEAGLADRPRTPLRSPRATQRAVVSICGSIITSDLAGSLTTSAAFTR